MTDTTTDLIQRYAAEIQRIINTGTNADHTWVGLLSALVQEYAGDHVPTFTDLHAFLDLASFWDHLSVTVAIGDDTLTARIEGSVLAADPAVCIDLLDGAPYVLRKERGIVWAPVRCATLSRDGQTIATYLEAQQTEASLRRGLADITAGRTVDLGSFAQPEPEPLGGSDFMDWMADRLADPEVRAGYLAAHAREVREQVARELIPVVAHKGRNDTDLSLLDEAAHRVEHGYSLDSNITTAVVRLIRNAIHIARKEQP